jgi:hypothetical protein
VDRLIGRVVGPADVAALAVHIMINTALTGATHDLDGVRRQSRRRPFLAFPTANRDRIVEGLTVAPKEIRDHLIVAAGRSMGRRLRARSRAA